MLRRLSTPLLLAALVLFPACDSAGSATECLLVASSDTAPTNMTVSYSATATGDASFDRITYLDNTGERTVNSPGKSWTMNVTVSEGTEIGIEGRGEVEDGSLKVAYTGDYSLGLGSSGTLSSSDDCSVTVN